ncbi:MAG: retroviral-like aspartic protease [Candidatus Kerfeldbacteria bacterium]|nr:retroviral-like aspartic protease [Candidatus Kerfeldbacteria bacterium]
MKFKYKRYGQGILRPVIPVEVRFGKQSVRYEVMVDSGADGSFFDWGIAETLGIDVEAGERVSVQGITGEPGDCFRHSVTLVVGGHEIAVPVGFMQLPEDGIGAVGQEGFFERFIVKFDYQKREIELKPTTNL